MKRETICRVSHVNRDRDPALEIVDATPITRPQVGVVRVVFVDTAGTWRVNDDVQISVEKLTLEDVTAEWETIVAEGQPEGGQRIDSL